MKTGLTNEKVSFPFQKLKVLRKFKAINDSLILRIAAPEPNIYIVIVQFSATVSCS